MIGARLSVVSDQFEYVFGLLVGDGGLVPDRDFMPAGGAEFVIDPDAWGRLDDEVRQEIARWSMPGSEIAVAPRGDGTAGPEPIAAKEPARPARTTSPARKATRATKSSTEEREQ